MHLVHEIGMRSTGEDSRIERHAKFELEVGMTRPDGALFVFSGQILSLRIACQLVAQLPRNGRQGNACRENEGVDTFHVRLPPLSIPYCVLLAILRLDGKAVKYCGWQWAAMRKGVHSRAKTIVNEH